VKAVVLADRGVAVARAVIRAPTRGAPRKRRSHRENAEGRTQSAARAKDARRPVPPERAEDRAVGKRAEAERGTARPPRAMAPSADAERRSEASSGSVKKARVGGRSVVKGVAIPK
jgi:hypothetical protein